MNYLKETILADRENCQKVAETLQFLWVKDILIQTEMDLEGCFSDSDDPNDQSIENRAKLRETLNNNDIYIQEEEDLKIFIQDTLIGHWKKPLFKLKTDLSQKNPKQRLYVEIEIEHWSVFNDLNEIEDNSEN